LLSDVDSRSCWQLAGQAGDPTPRWCVVDELGDAGGCSASHGTYLSDHEQFG